MSALTNYMEAWVANDADLIAGAVTENCVVTECYGPVYRGRDRVSQWAREWFAAGGIVHRWEITDHFVSEDREAVQWRFECTWDGKRSEFEGATIARVSEGLILELREYETSAPLYDWQGTWH